MDTLPLDLHRLLDNFSDYGLRSTLSLHSMWFDIPVRCNNLKEAIMTDNWCYINTYFYAPNPTRFELVHEHRQLSPFYKHSLSDFINKLEITKKTMIFDIDPNYGPPHCLFNNKRLDKNSYLREVDKLTIKPSTTTITLSLITHTPIICDTGKLRYQPVVGCICSNELVTNYVVVECTGIILIAPITFISSSIVQYDDDTDKIEIHFDHMYRKWSDVNGHQYYEFDRLILGDRLVGTIGPMG